MFQRTFGGVLAMLVGLSVVSGIVWSMPETRTPWDDLAARAGLTSAQLRLPPDRWRDGGKQLLPIVERLSDDWPKLEDEGRAVAREFLRDASSMTALLDDAVGRAALARAAPPEVAATTTDLAFAIEQVHEALGQSLSFARSRALREQVATVPSSVATRAATLLSAVPVALEARAASIARFRPGARGRIALARKTARAFATHFQVNDVTRELFGALDSEALVGGARALAAAMDRDARSAIAPTGSFSFAWDTPAGAIALSGDGDDVHEGRFLLLIDRGGNDTYRLRATPVQLVIDDAGDDVYEGDAALGLVGYALLRDGGGNDRYETLDLGQGCGVFGVAIAVDSSGDDRRKARRLAQGAGCFGVGIVADLGGDDVYECLQKSQGFGETRGTGVLVDAAGNDRYVADDSQVVDPSPQTAEHNVSLAQGCGYGRRAHPGDGWSYAGGVGILVDGGGDDHYSCGVFGQGTAYWYGLGFLVDLGGNDRYDGVWYVQGSAAHFALACLVDGAGNDRYAASMHQSQGAGHDLSVGVLVDGGGDDEYRCPGTCLGGGSWNGVGAFRDDGGNDHYVTGGQAIGWASGAEEGRRCIGVFVDRAGKDRYEPEPGPELLGPRVYGLRAR